MTRKITAIITATLLMLALLPAAVAYAVENATAQLIPPSEGADPVNVFPGLGQTVAIRVTNNPPGGGLPLIGGGSADPIRFVNVVLPSDAGFVNNSTVLPAPENWSVHVGAGGPLQTIQFIANEGEAGIPSGGSLDFRFLSEVKQPLNGDRAGRFQVFVDNDRFGDNQVEAGSTGNGLTSTIRALQILPNTLEAISPDGVLDQSGTAGQEIEYAFRVHNHARTALDVVPALSSSNGGDQITQGAPVTIGPDDDEQVTSTVVLGSASSDRTSTFTAEATATNANPASTRALPLQRNFTVHRLVELLLHSDQFRPTHVSNFENPTEYHFELPVTKNATQAHTVERERDGGQVSTLTFCGNEVPLYGFLNAQGNRVAGDVSFAPGNNQAGTLVFGPIVGDDIQAPAPSGDIHECDGDFVLDGEDGNGFPTVVTELVNNLITIDIRIPVINLRITLPFDDDGDLQLKAKNSDDIIVTGDINLGCETLHRVALEHDEGGTIRETERTPEGWTNETVSCSGGDFNVTFENVDFGPDQVFELGDFVAVGNGESQAGRPGDGFSEVVKFDNWEPVFNFAQTTVINSGSYAGRHGVIVGFQENDTLIGACDTSQWEVSGQGSVVFGSVEDVLYINGERCQRGQAGPDGGTSRILVVEGLDSIDETPDVEYTPGESSLPITLGALPGELTGPLAEAADALPLPLPPFHQLPVFDPDRAKDAAGHFAAENIVQAIVGILPPLPDLDAFTRANSQSGEPEEAREVDGVRWTRFSNPGDIEVRVGRAQPNYLIRVMEAVLEGDDCIVGTQQGGDHVAGDGENWVPVTVGPAEGVYTFAIQLRNAFDWGPAKCFEVGLDQTAPVFDAVDRLSSNSVRVTLTERVWGANVNSAWYAWEHGEWDEDEETGGRIYYGSTGVSGDEETRTLEVNLQGGPQDFGGADYAPSTADTRRLEDKAGNKLEPTVTFQ